MALFRLVFSLDASAAESWEYDDETGKFNFVFESIEEEDVIRAARRLVSESFYPCLMSAEEVSENDH